MNDRNIFEEIVSPYILWIGFFAYTTSTALLFQNVILPLIPSLHAGEGLLFGDAVHFHKVAVAMAEAMARDGWQAWAPWPPPNTQGNTGVLAALYYLFGPNPAVAVPLNACMHATSGILLVLIGKAIDQGKGGRFGMVLGALLFVAFPSSLNWNGQIHKDGYAILGFFLIVYAGVATFKKGSGWHDFAIVLVSLSVGLAVTVFVRPNNLLIFLIPASTMLVFALARCWKDWFRFLFQIGFVFVIFAAALVVRPEAHEAQLSAGTVVLDSQETHQDELDRFIGWRWERSDYLPLTLDKLGERVSHLRVFLAAFGIRENARSMMDIDRLPANFAELVQYFPRALSIGLFAPFPNSWANALSLPKMLGIAEISVWYIAFPGFLFLLWTSRRNEALWWLVFSVLGILSLESYVTANLGTLHRIRYPFLCLFILLGTMGWLRFLGKLSIHGLGNVRLSGSKVALVAALGEPAEKAAIARRMIRRGLVVVFLTGCVYFGLFVRDLLLARIFGLGIDLDAFQLGSFFTLSAAGLLAVPLGPVLINAFFHIREASSKEAVESWVSAMSAAMLVLFATLAIVVGGFLVFGKLGGVSEAIRTKVVFDLLPILLVVVALSGSVVLGNAVLAASGRAEQAILAQLAVPVVSIAFIALWGGEWGAVAASLGLLLGQVVNYLIVLLAVRSLGYSFKPRFGTIYWQRWIGQYLPLVAASALTTVAIPVGVYLASSLSEGSIGAFSLGAKVIQFATGLVSAALIAVVLPHFSKLSASGRLLELRKSLEFFVSLGTAIAVPVSLVVYVMAEEIASILFEGGRVTSDAVLHLGAVVRYTSLQFPFFVVMAVLIKFTVASRETAWVFFAAVLGQVVNFGVGGILANKFGVSGVAMAMTLGMLTSSLTLLLWAMLKAHVTIVLFLLVGVAWLLFLTLSICIHYGNTPGVVVCFLAFLVVFAGQFKTFAGRASYLIQPTGHGK